MDFEKQKDIFRLSGFSCWNDGGRPLPPRLALFGRWTAEIAACSPWRRWPRRASGRSAARFGRQDCALGPVGDIGVCARRLQRTRFDLCPREQGNPVYEIVTWRGMATPVEGRNVLPQGLSGELAGPDPARAVGRDSPLDEPATGRRDKMTACAAIVIGVCRGFEVHGGLRNLHGRVDFGCEQQGRGSRGDAPHQQCATRNRRRTEIA